MDKLIIPCRYLFALSLIVFGIQHFMYADFVATLVPAWIPGHLFWAYFIGIIFLAAAGCLVLNIQVSRVFYIVGGMIMAFVLLIHLPKIIGNSHDGGNLTNACKDLAIASASLMLGAYTSRK